MRIALRINNREFALEITNTKCVDTYSGYTLDELLSKHAQEPDQGLTLIPTDARIPIKYPTPSAKPHVSPSVVAEIKLRTAGLIRCSCIHYETGLATPGACTECAEAGRHSGGCEVQGCEHGFITALCYCLRPGYVKCFECGMSNEHTSVCANCSPQDTEMYTEGTAV